LLRLRTGRHHQYQQHRHASYADTHHIFPAGISRKAILAACRDVKLQKLIYTPSIMILSSQ
jgi:hypothetical protein